MVMPQQVGYGRHSLLSSIKPFVIGGYTDGWIIRIDLTAEKKRQLPPRSSPSKLIKLDGPIRGVMIVVCIVVVAEWHD